MRTYTAANSDYRKSLKVHLVNLSGSASMKRHCVKPDRREENIMQKIHLLKLTVVMP